MIAMMSQKKCSLLSPRRLFTAFLAMLLLLPGLAAVAEGEHYNHSCDLLSCDFGICDSIAEDPAAARDFLTRKSQRNRDWRARTPEMVGSFFGGSPLSFRGDHAIDRLLVLADDLDSPAVLPGPGAFLSLTEPGPVGIFDTSLQSIQQLQGLLRDGSPIPGASLAGIITDDATLTTALNVSDLQASLAIAGLPYEIIQLTPPPGSYDAGVSAAFATRSGAGGTTVYDSAGSGALIQGGVNQLIGGEDLDAFYFYDYVIRVDTALADASSGGVGRLKISEGGTVLPQTRVFMRYNHFAGVNYGTRQSLNRFTPGFELAFLENLLSFELRAPFASDARTTSSLHSDGITSGRHTRFGNLSLYAKALLYSGNTLAVSGGSGISLPTASDVEVNYFDGTPLLDIQNNAVHLQPFVGFLYTPTPRWFAQGFVQHDISLSGNRVSINADGTGLNRVGTLTDPNHLFLDLGAGYWAYRSQRDSGLTGIIPMVEFHHATGMGRGEAIESGAFQVGNFNATHSLTSFAAATTLEFGQATRLTAAYAAPLSSGQHRRFNGAFQLMLTRSL